MVFRHECSRRIGGHHQTLLQDDDAVREELYFLQRMRGEEQGSAALGDDFLFQEAAELDGGNGIHASCGLVQQQDSWFVEQRAKKAEPLQGSGGKGAHLAVQSITKLEAVAEGADARVHRGIRKLIQLAEKAQVFPPGKSGVKTEIAACVVAQLPAHRRTFADRFMACYARGSFCWEKESGEDAQKRSFSRAIRAKQRDGFAWSYFQRHAAQCGRRRRCKWLQKSAPPAVRGREPFFQFIDGNRGSSHVRTYNVSRSRKQCVAAARPWQDGRPPRS